jgi:hypothetical protein
MLQLLSDDVARLVARRLDPASLSNLSRTCLDLHRSLRRLWTLVLAFRLLRTFGVLRRFDRACLKMAGQNYYHCRLPELHTVFGMWYRREYRRVYGWDRARVETLRRNVLNVTSLHVMRCGCSTRLVWGPRWRRCTCYCRSDSEDSSEYDADSG